MNPESAQRVEALCLEALSKAEPDRGAFLEHACGGDDALRREVESLLAGRSAAGGFLETPAWAAATPLAPGTHLGPFEIQAAIGAGGMGEVYRAKDTRLDRTVAIKVLPPAVSADPERRARFQREAKVIAGLTHPHICTLYDVGEHPSTGSGQAALYLVMECLQGETLSDRLVKGALPLHQALTIATEIADALAAAHRQGIIHRDLKPGNVMLTKAGAKLLDFGLAKLKGHGDRPGAALTAVPTPSASLTGEGMIVGTLPYMAPEQLEGREADARTDIFAFGVLVYEMLAGRRPFSGQSPASVISAIMTSEPPAISSVRPAAPPALDRAIQRCVAKDPDDRWQSAGDLLSELRWIAGGGSQPGVAAVHSRTGTRLLWAAVAVLSLALVASLAQRWVHRPEAPVPRPHVRFSVAPPAPYTLAGLDVPALSPDGTRLAFTAKPADGPSVLFVRAFDSLDSKEIPQTAGASSPFWSPDGQRLGYFSGGRLKTVRLSGGSPVTLVDGACCVTWSRDGVILFTGQGPNVRDLATFRIDSEGGVAARVRPLDVSRSEGFHQWPLFLPDGRRFLYYARSGRRDFEGIHAASLDPGQATRVMHTAANVAFVPPGFLVFRLGGRLMAQAYDWQRSRLTGEATQVADMVAGTFLTAYFSAVPNALAYIPGTATPTALTWLDRKGNRLGSVGVPGEYYHPQLSPDGRTLVVSRSDLATETRDIWVIDLARETQTRLTVDPADDLNPAWSPDGARIAFTSNRKGQRDIYEKQADGIGEERLLLTSDTEKNVECWLPDGRSLLFNVLSGGGKREVWALSVAGEGRSHAVLSGPADIQSSQLSPDGKFIAYSATESGRSEIFVQNFPPAGNRWPISTAGGRSAQWRRDGKELFYVAGSSLMAVDIKVEGARLVPRAPRVLFDAPFANAGRNVFVPSRDGQRFLAILQLEQPGSRSITVELNWMARLKQ